MANFRYVTLDYYSIYFIVYLYIGVSSTEDASQTISVSKQTISQSVQIFRLGPFFTFIIHWHCGTEGTQYNMYVLKCLFFINLNLSQIKVLYLLNLYYLRKLY